MYNRSAYNRLRYNQNPVPPNELRTRQFAVVLNLESAMGRNIRLVSQPMESIYLVPNTNPQRVKVLSSMPMELNATYSSAAYTRVRMIAPVSMDLTLQSSAKRQIQHMEFAPSDTTLRLDTIHSFAALDIGIDTEMNLWLNAEAYPESTIGAMSEPLTLQIDFSGENTAFTTKESIVNVTIKPGQTLIINSDQDYFTAYLDNVNVLEEYTGAFMNIDADTLMLALSFNGNSVAYMQVEYQELWV